MADNNTTTSRATFETREAADLAVEHLVQQHGISRPDIFIQSASDRNTTRSRVSSGDLYRDDAPLEGEIEVSADIADQGHKMVREPNPICVSRQAAIFIRRGDIRQVNRKKHEQDGDGGCLETGFTS